MQNIKKIFTSQKKYVIILYMVKLDKLFDSYNLDGILLANNFNIKYVSGYSADYAFVLISKKGNFYFTDGRFIIEANRDLDSSFAVVEITPSTAEQVITKVIADIDIKNVGFDSDLNHYDYLFVTEKLLKNVATTDITQGIRDMRAVKSDFEIECITKAQRIAEKSLEQTKACIKEGMTELELCAILEYFMKTNGSSKPSFDTIVAFGENSAIAHAKPSDRKLKVGDVILIDFGATYNGYCSDMTRTFVFGECSEKIEQLYNAVLGANEIAIDCIRSGIPPREADRVARNYLDLFLLSPYFNHSLGHGVGLEIHEYPTLSQRIKTDDKLLDGMVVTIEPGVYIEGLCGIRIEDMIVVKGANAINLTTSNKKLEIINI